MTEPTEQQKSLAHLHIHTEYSLVDGAIRIDDLLNKVAKLGHTSVAITDHGNLFGAIEFYAKAASKGINPIIGAEIYCEPHPDTLAFIKKYDAASAHTHSFNAIVLAKSTLGYQNLVKLVSAGYLTGDNNPVPVVPLSRFKELTKDLFVFPSFHGGEVSYLIKQMRKRQTVGALEFVPGPDEAYCEALVALNAVKKAFVSMLDPNSFYVELCSNNLPGEDIILDDVAAWAKSSSLPLVASANAHYLNPEDQEAHLVLLAVKNDLKLPALKNRRKNVRAHVFNDEEMREFYKAWPEALANTGHIASQCKIKFEFGKYFLPKIVIDEAENTEQALNRLAREGLRQRIEALTKLYGPEFNEEKQKEYWARLDYEIKVISDMGFPDYFLIVQDFINWAKTHGIPVGPGRGSGAGSLVAYALKITDIDPLPYNLIFERFLNPERVSMPDFDVDFCQFRRDEVIKYVSARYGVENVAQITTFGKMLAKAAIRDVGRVLDLSYGKVDRIAKLIPNELGIRLQDAIDREPRLTEEANKDPLIADLLKIALQLEGISRHTSVHAAGLVISDGAMENYVPVYKSTDGSLITQFEMKNAEKVGLVKFDFLGLKTLTVIQMAIQLIAKTTGQIIDIAAIPLEDRKVYNLISEAKSIGVFQLESSGMQQLLLKLKPSTFEDIIALVALFRPGPLQSGMVDDFVERKHGRQKIEYLHPALEPILKDTYGTILYQEQVQKVAAVLANYSLGEADLLRRAMGKKKPEEMAKQKSRFVDGCIASKIDEQVASTLFDLMAKFAEYGFNKSHSAAYGLVSYQTAYLKTHFSAQFLAASMTCDMDNSDKIVRYVKDCRAMSIKVLPPDVNASELDFSVPAKNTIRFGLAAIKGIGRASVEPLIEERELNGAFQNLTSFAKRLNLNKIGKKTIELLIQAGAFDSFGFSRIALFSRVGELVKYSQNLHEAKSAGQLMLFSEMAQDEDESDQFANITKAGFDSNLALLEWLHKEKKLLGVYLSSHPLALFNAERDKYCNARLKDLPKLGGQSDIYVMALLYDQFERFTKDGKRMLVLRLEDEEEDIAPGFFEGEYPQNLPAMDSPVICKFRVSKGFEDFPARPRIEQVWSLDDYRRTKIRGIELSLNGIALGKFSNAVATQTVIEQLKSLLQSNPGHTPVRLTLTYDKARVQLTPIPIKIDPSTDLISGLKSFRKQYPDVLMVQLH